MRLSIQVRRRAFVRTAIQLAVAFPITFSLLTFDAVAQDRSTGKNQNAKTVPATAASAKTAVPNANANVNNPNAGPAVVATVNGLSISLAELAVQCRQRFGEDILDDLVNKTLIQQACVANKITVSEKDVDDEIARTASKFNLSMSMYLKLIEDERNISAAQYASDIIWPMLALRGLSKDKISVSPQEIDRAFQSEFGPKVQVRMIACKDLQKLKGLQQQALAKPELFKTLARDNSEDATSASVEGLLPPIRRFMGDDEIENIAFGLQPDQISQIFSAGDLNIILQCVKHLPPTNPPAAQMQEIQNRIRMDLEDKKLRGMAENVYKALRESAQVTIVHGDRELEAQHPNVAAIVNRQSLPMEWFDQACVKRHGKQILEGEINRKLIEEALNSSKQQVTQADINSEIARAADYYGFVNKDGSPNIEEWMKHILAEDGVSADVYIRDAIWPTVALKKLIAGKVEVTEEDIRKGFESNYGPRAEILAIVLSNQRTAQSVWEMARGNNSEQFFGELASQYSVEPSSKSNSGKVPPLRRFGGQPNLEKAAFDLKPGDLSGIIEVNGQYVILKSQGQTTPVTTDINAVKQDLYKDILEKKQRVAMDAYLAKLIENSQITNFLDPKKSRIGMTETQAALDTLKQQQKTQPTAKR